MRIAFDFDGTLSRFPEKLGKMAYVLSQQNEVLCLTAGAGELPFSCRHAEMKKRLLRIGLGWMRLVCVEELEKAPWCDLNKVDILIDDTPFKMDFTIQLVPIKWIYPERRLEDV